MSFYRSGLVAALVLTLHPVLEAQEKSADLPQDPQFGVCIQLRQRTDGMKRALDALDLPAAEENVGALLGLSRKFSELSAKVVSLSEQTWAGVERRERTAVKEALKGLRQSVEALHPIVTGRVSQGKEAEPVCLRLDRDLQALERAVENTDLNGVLHHREALRETARELANISVSLAASSKSMEEGVRELAYHKVVASVQLLDEALRKCHGNQSNAVSSEKKNL